MRMLVVGDFQGVFSEKLKKKIRKEAFDMVIGVGDYTGIREWRPYVMQQLRLAKQGIVLPPELYFGKQRFRSLLKKDEAAAKNVLRLLNELGKPVLFVFGNGDDAWYTYPFDHSGNAKSAHLAFVRRLKQLHNITYGKKTMFGATFIGFGGYMDIDAYFDRKLWKDESKERVEWRLRRRVRSKKKLFSILKQSKGERVFMFHYPPKGVFDIIKDKKDNPMNGKSTGIGFFREAIKKYQPRLVLCGHMHEYQGAQSIGRTLVVNPGDAEKGKYAIVDYPEEKGKMRVKFVK